MKSGVLPLNKYTLSKLIKKHPKVKTASQYILLNGSLHNIHPVKFHLIDVEIISKAATRTKESSGPSGMDANGWRKILASNNFGIWSNDLRKAFANVVEKLCTDLVETHTIKNFLSSHLIPSNKNPGLRLIGVGEVLQRIVSEVIVSVLKKYATKCTGTLQIRVGQEAGIEAAIHSMTMMFEETIQRDPVSMAIYGKVVTPLINMLIDILSNEYSANVTEMIFQPPKVYKI